MAVATVVVGLGLGVGFGAISVDSLLDSRAFPAKPTPLTVAELVAMPSFPRGTWVTITDARPECARGYAKPHDTEYVLVGDGVTPHLVIAALHDATPCARLTPRELTGVPVLRRTADAVPGTDLPEGLAWPGLDWQKWPAQRAVIVWTASGPGNARTGIWLGAGFALLGVWLTWYGIRWLVPRIGDTVVVDPSEFPASVPLAKRGGALPAAVVWLPVLRAQAVKARGIATDVTVYDLAMPPTVSPLATRTQPTLSVHTGPGAAGLVFRTSDRESVAAARLAGSDELVVLRSDLAELELTAEGRKAWRTRHLRPLVP